MSESGKILVSAGRGGRDGTELASAPVALPIGIAKQFNWLEFLKPQRTQRNTKILGGIQVIVTSFIFTQMVKGKNKISTVYFAISLVSAYLCVLCGSRRKFNCSF